MRRTLELICFAVFTFLLWITVSALYGSNPLPQQIAIHFGHDGQPNGWGSPASLWMLPGIALLVYGGMTLVARFPASFNYPVRVTAENRARLEELTLRFIALLKTELLCLFSSIQWCVIESARQGRLMLPPLLVPLCIAAIFLTIGWHLVAIFRGARPV